MAKRGLDFFDVWMGGPKNCREIFFFSFFHQSPLMCLWTVPKCSSSECVGHRIQKLGLCFIDISSINNRSKYKLIWELFLGSPPFFYLQPHVDNNQGNCLLLLFVIVTDMKLTESCPDLSSWNTYKELDM